MADDQHIWVEIEGDKETEYGLLVYEGYMQARLKNLLDELAKDGVTFLGKNVPQDTFYSEGYTLRHVDRTDVHGDYGAGGEFSATVGIKTGKSYHPVYVNRGTGVYGPFIKQPYTTKPPGGLMWFHASRIGARIGRERVQGQRAQHFLYITFRELQVFALARMTTGAF